MTDSSRRVMVVHGRNEAARNAMFTFLRSLGLSPIEWEQAVGMTGRGTPYNLEAVKAAMSDARAVVVVLTAEDEATLLPSLESPAERVESSVRGQPRPNVLIEAGLAIGLSEQTTILVEIGPLRRASDFAGLNVVRLSNAHKGRHALRQRLTVAGCVVEDAGDYLSPSTGGDFESCVVAPTSCPTDVPRVVGGATSVSREPGHMEVFWLGPKSEVCYRWWHDESGWSAPHSWEQPPATALAAISRRPGDELLFGRHPDGRIWYRTWEDDGEGSRRAGDPRWLDDAFVDGPIAVSSLDPGHIELVATGTDGELVHRYYDHEGWHPWDSDWWRRSEASTRTRNTPID